MATNVRASEAELIAGTALLLLRKQREEREAHVVELERCKTDIPYWISTYCKTFDPDAVPKEQAFKLYRFQEEFIADLEEHYRERRDILVEKSRKMGVTWMAVAWHLHHWRFEEGFQSIWGSKTEDDVDNWEMDTLFPKAEYILKWLKVEAPWLAPAYKRSFCRLVNLDNKAAIIGESANPDFSRSGRYNTAFLDEFAFWPWAKTVRTATADATGCRIVVSTPNYKNEFHRWRTSGKIDVKRLHWRQHPNHHKAWEERERGRRTEEEWAKEQEISYDVSVRGQVYPTFGQIKQGDFPFVPGWALFTSWDFGGTDDNAIIWWQMDPKTGLFRAVDCYSNAGKTIDFYVPFCTGIIESGLPYQYSQDDLEKIESHKGWGLAAHFGDPAGRQRNQVTRTSVIEELAKPGRGIYVQTAPDMNTFEQRYHATQLFLRRIEGINTPTCDPLVDAINSARFPERAENSQAMTEVSKPVHDESSHYRTSLEYFAVNAPGTGVEKQQKRQKAAWEYW